jgi:hypothetical protein
MKKIIITSVLLSCVFLSNAQEINPFESIGKEGKILTLSNGKYTEVHVNDSLQRIGSVIVNMNTGTIYKLLDIDTLYSEATLDPTVIGRWYSLDPLASAYTAISPYVFVANTPIIATDKDGRKIVFGWMSSQESISRFKTVLENEFSGKVEARIIDGMLTIHQKEGMVLTESEKILYDNLNIVITDDATVEIDIVQNTEVETGSFSIAFDEDRGTFYKNVIDISDVEKYKSSNSTPGAAILHEIWESYLTQAAGINEGSIEKTFSKVHSAALKKEASVLGITIVDGMSFTKEGSGNAYTNFLDKEGKEKHFEVIYKNGDVESFTEKSGHIDLNQKLKEHEDN